MRNKGKIALLISLVTIFSCQETKMQVATLDKNTLNTQNTSELKDIFEEKEINCPKETGFSTKAFTPTTSVINLPTEQQILDNLAPHPTFDDVNQLPPITTKTGHIVLIFKDQYKIRLTVEEEDNHEKNKYKFEAKTDGAEKAVKVINKLIKDNKIVVNSNVPYAEKSKNEKEKIEKDEEAKEKFVEQETEKKTKKKYDFPNRLAIYDLFIPDGNVASITTQLRALNVTLSANFMGDRTAGSSAITNDPIFNNGSYINILNTFYPFNSGVVMVDKSLGYHFFRINAPKAWDLAKQYSIKPSKIAILDNGFDINNLDSPNYDKNNWAVIGDNKIERGNMADITIGGKHGAAVGAVIGAKGNNNYGSVGLISNEILGLEETSAGYIIPIVCTFNLSNISRAIEEAIALGVKVITISINTLDNTDVIEQDLEVRSSLLRAYNAGILCIISAGNGNSEIKYDSNKYTGALVVGATEKFSNERALFNQQNTNLQSNYGDRIDISAPGYDIFLPNENSFYFWRGSSFSTPMVSSTASLLRGYNPNLNVEQIKQLIIFSSKLIQTNKQMGPSKKYYTGVGAITNPPTIPNGRLLDMGKALEMAITMNNSNSIYIRNHNTDSHIKIERTTPTGIPAIDKYYKNDSITEFPDITSSFKLESYNQDCVYSLGHQIWKNNLLLSENVAGIAGQLLPANTPLPTKSNSEYLTSTITFNN
ncbi:MAG: S8 family serine peptidase [Candidatus Sericytochromatia bacterium]